MEPTRTFETLFREQILQCSRCGFCQAVCPVYGATLRPSLNARGKMLLLKEVMDGTLALDEALVETLFQCTTCASCARSCPSGVNVPEILKQVRRDMVALGTCHPAFKGMNQVLEAHTNIYAEEEAPDLGRPRNKKADIVYFVGCVGAYREEEATLAALGILDHLEVDYTLVDEVCCSGVLQDMGFEIKGNLVARNLEAVLGTGAKTLVTGCPYCYRTFRETPPYAALREKGVEIVHISQFLAGFDLGVRTERRVTYHDPCDLGRHCGIYEAPRKTIRRIAPHFVEMAHHGPDALCCGAGGGVRGAFPKNSLAMARRRLQEAEAAGVEIVLTECNSCVHNLTNARLRKQPFQIYTTEQFLHGLLKKTSKV